MADIESSAASNIGSAISRSSYKLEGLFKKRKKESDKKSSDKNGVSEEDSKPTEAPASATPAPRPRRSSPRGRNATFKDTAAAVTANKITRLDAIQLSPTYAKKYATKVEDYLMGEK